MDDTQEYIRTEMVEAYVKDPANTNHYGFIFSVNGHKEWFTKNVFKKQFKSLTSGEMDYSMAMWWLLHGDGRRVGRKLSYGETFGVTYDANNDRVVFKYLRSGSCAAWDITQEEIFAKDYYVLDWPK